MTVWVWLNSAGPHFPGGWSIKADAEKCEHRATLAHKDLPHSMHKTVRGIIRSAALDVGWLAKYVKIGKASVEFSLKPYPLEQRLLAEAKSESFRQAAHRKREESRLHREDSHTPVP